MTLMANDMLKGGRTALIYASRYGHSITVQALLADARVQVNLMGKVSVYVLNAFMMH